MLKYLSDFNLRKIKVILAKRTLVRSTEHGMKNNTPISEDFKLESSGMMNIWDLPILNNTLLIYFSLFFFFFNYSSSYNTGY